MQHKFIILNAIKIQTQQKLKHNSVQKLKNFSAETKTIEHKNKNLKFIILLFAVEIFQKVNLHAVDRIYQCENGRFAPSSDPIWSF